MDTLEQDGDAKGSVFEGEWADGWLSGKGSYSLSVGIYYVGEIKENRPNGHQGETVVRRAIVSTKNNPDRFEAARGTAYVKWRTNGLTII